MKRRLLIALRDALCIWLLASAGVWVVRSVAPDTRLPLLADLSLSIAGFAVSGVFTATNRLRHVALVAFLLWLLSLTNLLFADLGLGRSLGLGPPGVVALTFIVRAVRMLTTAAIGYGLSCLFARALRLPRAEPAASDGSSPPSLPRSRPAVAVWSLVLSFLGLFCLGPLASIPGVVCGHMAHARIRRSHGALSGESMSAAGVGIGYVAILIWIVLLSFVAMTSTTGRYAVSRLMNPIRHEFTIEARTVGVANEDARRLERVVSSRLRQATVPHRIIPEANGRWRVQVGEPKGTSLEETRALVTTVGFLEFRLVHLGNHALVEELFAKQMAPEGYRLVRLSEESFYVEDPLVRRDPANADYLKRLGSFATPSEEYEFMLERVEREGQTAFRPCFVKRRAEMTGDHIKSAHEHYRTSGTPVIDIALDAFGKRAFANIPDRSGYAAPNGSDYRRLAIVVDGRLCSAPIIREPILNGRLEISGRFTVAETKALAVVLGSGPLPCPVAIVGEREIGK